MFYVSAKVIPQDANEFDVEPQHVAFKVAAMDGDTALTLVRQGFRQSKLKVVKWVRCAPFDPSKVNKSFN